MRPQSRGRAGRRIGAAVLGLSALGLALLAAAGHDRRTFAVEGNGILAESADLPPGGSAVVEVGFTRPGTYALLARRPEANPKRSDLTIIP